MVRKALDTLQNYPGYVLLFVVAVGVFVVALGNCS